MDKALDCYSLQEVARLNARIRALEKMLSDERDAAAQVMIIENPLLVKRSQFRFPKGKRKRIRKKFAKNQKNYRNNPDTSFYFMKNQNCFVCHPSMATKIRASLSGA